MEVLGAQRLMTVPVVSLKPPQKQETILAEPQTTRLLVLQVRILILTTLLAELMVFVQVEVEAPGEASRIGLTL
jgi:hypothetical protein